MAVKIEQQIDSLTGLPNKEGLTTNCSLFVLGDEHVAEGTNFLPNTLHYTTERSTTATDWSLDVVSNTTYKVNFWFKYYTDGGPWGSVTAPLSGNNVIGFNSGSTTSHSGIYQKLTGLIVGFKYKVFVRLSKYYPVSGSLSSSSGTCSIITYYENADIYLKNTEETFTILGDPPTTLPANTLTSEFTAQTSEDIILIDFSSNDTGSFLLVHEISVRRIDEYLIPAQSSDVNDNFSTVYKSNIQNVSLEQVDDPEIPEE
tara:strand:+ start:718 stop:1491 length:774 start_codon:yes stop_codon:yes gene_type:complete